MVKILINILTVLVICGLVAYVVFWITMPEVVKWIASSVRHQREMDREFKRALDEKAEAEKNS